MTEQVEFVPAKAGDAESIGRLRQRIWDTTYRGIYPDTDIDGFDYEWHRERDLRRISDPSFMVYLIRCGGVVLLYDMRHQPEIMAYQLVTGGTVACRHKLKIRLFLRSAQRRRKDRPAIKMQRKE